MHSASRYYDNLKSKDCSGTGLSPAGPPSGVLRPLEHVVHARLGSHAVAVGGEEAEEVGLPFAAAEDEERGIERLGGVAEERLEDQVLGAFDVDLDGVETVDALVADELEQGRRRHPDGRLADADELDARLAAVARIEKERQLAQLVGDGAGDRLDGAEGVEADVVGQAVEDVGVRLDRENARRRPGERGHGQRIGADAGADVDEGEAPDEAAYEGVQL